MLTSINDAKVQTSIAIANYYKDWKQGLYPQFKTWKKLCECKFKFCQSYIDSLLHDGLQPDPVEAVSERRRRGVIRTKKSRINKTGDIVNLARENKLIAQAVRELGLV